MIQTYGIDVKNGDVEFPSLLCIFKLRGAVPFRGAVVRIDRPPDNIRLQVVQPGDSFFIPEVAAQPDSGLFAEKVKRVKSAALPVFLPRRRLLPARRYSAV